MRAGPRGRRPRRPRSIGALAARREFELLGHAVAPAVAAAAVVALRSNRPKAALVVFGALMAASLLLPTRRLPLHLMPLARVVGAALGPVVGLTGAAALFALLDRPLPGRWLLAALLAAWLILALATLLRDALAAARPVRLAVIGARRDAVRLAAALAGANVRGYVVLGHVDPGGTRSDGTGDEDGMPRLGGLAELAEVARVHDVDVVVVDDEHAGLDVLERAAEACLPTRVRMVEAGALYEELLGHVPLAAINAAWFRYLLHPRYRREAPHVRRALDVAVGLPLAVACAPLVAALALAIRLSDGGPALYRQRRVGERGREFDMLKLRTMRLDAEPSGPVWHAPGDERVTPIGRVLRRTHLDELPQVFNLLRGDMTLVGPRPERPGFVADLARTVPYYERRHLVKPGITGWAQVRCGYGGSELGSAWKTSHDLFYLKHRSLALDLLILVETANAIVGESRPRRMPAEEILLAPARGPSSP